MKIFLDPLGQDDPPRGAVLSIGNFDGVHVGHQAVLRHVVTRSTELETVSAAMTFDPHPTTILRPREAPRLVTTLDQRLEMFGRMGVEVALVVPFTQRFARLSADVFIREVLVDRLGVREVYIGRNFRFGADRGGDVELLVAAGRELGFAAASAPIVTVGDHVVSSTQVRAAIAAGDLELAEALLGRVVAVDGKVLEGKRLGRRLGFPTLNVEMGNELFPAPGVYITAVHIPSFGRVFPSVTNIGVRPTIYERSAMTVESHLLDFTGDVYHEKVRLYFLARLREERVFASPVQLMTQIGRDVLAARTWFAAHPVSDLGLHRL